MNPDFKALSGRLRVTLLHGLSGERVLWDKPVSVAPARREDDGWREDSVFLVPYTASKTEGGREVRAVLSFEGGRRVAAREFFLVTDRPLRMTHGGTLGEFPARVWTEETRDLEWEREVGRGLVRRKRKFYTGAPEMFAWAPDDFACLAPEADRWRSGQTLYFMSKPGLKAMIDEAHRQGMVASFYATKWIWGPVGFEFARQHPDGVFWGSAWYGGVWNVKELKVHSLRRYEGERPRTNCVTPIITRPEVMEHGLDQIAQCMRMFGWDGIRLDSYGWYVGDVKHNDFGEPAYSPGTDFDAVGADLVRRIRAAGRQARPDFLYGNNIGIGWASNLETAPEKVLAEAADGGMVMEEGFNFLLNPDYGVGAPFEKLRRYLHENCRGVRTAGGYPYVIGPGGSGHWLLPDGTHRWARSIRDEKILLALTFASGGHLYLTPLLLDYVRLSVRYGELLYDEDLEWVEEPSKLVTVAPSDSIWWRDYVRARTTATGRRQIIVHLINRPGHERYNELRPKAPVVLPQPELDQEEEAGSEEMPELEDDPPDDAGESTEPERCPMPDPDKKFALPPLVRKDIRATFTPPDAFTVRSVYALDAEEGVRSQRLQPQIGDGGVSVTLPRLLYWTVIVFEGDGPLTFPANRSQRQFAARRARPRIARTEGEEKPPRKGQEGKPQEVWTYTPGLRLTNKWANDDPSLIPPELVEDKGAEDGKSVLLERGQSLKWYLYSVPPGKYRMTVRLKAAMNEGAGGFSVSVMHLGLDWDGEDRHYSGGINVPAARVKKANVHQQFSKEMEVRSPPHPLFMRVKNESVGVMHLDRLQLRLLSRYELPRPLRTWRIERTGVSDPDAGDGQVRTCEKGSVKIDELPLGRFRAHLRVKRVERGQDNIFAHVGDYLGGFWGPCASSFTLGQYEEVVMPVERLSHGRVLLPTLQAPWLLLDRVDIHQLEAYTEADALEKQGLKRAERKLIPREGLQVWLAEGLFAKEAGILDALAAGKADVTSAWLVSHHSSKTLEGVVPNEYPPVGHDEDQEAIGGDAEEQAPQDDQPGGLLGTETLPDVELPNEEPVFEKRLMAYDVAILHDVPADVLDLKQRALIHDFVHAGGGLLVTGGMFGLDRGRYQSSDLLSGILPVRLSAKPTLPPMDKPAPLRRAENAFLAQELKLVEGRAVLWAHRVTPRKGATVLLWADQVPVIVTWTVGKGRVAVLAAPPYGAAPDGTTAYWACPEWPAVISSLLKWLSGSRS